MSCVLNSPPRFIGNSVDPSWVIEVIGGDSSYSATCEIFTEKGGLVSTLYKISVTDTKGTKTLYILKRIKTEMYASSKALFLGREVEFYKSGFSHEIGDDIVPHFVYGYYNIDTGEKYVMLEDLGQAIPIGFFYGPGNPNNWASKAILESMCEPYVKMGVDLDLVTRETFKLIAKVHAKFWMNPKLFEYPWLKGSDWMKQEGGDSWLASQGEVKDHWNEKLKNKTHIVKDKELFEIISASISKISLSDFFEWTKKTKWTFSHGDFHPSNIMWMLLAKNNNHIKLLDFETVGVGSGPQEIGQFFVSHVSPEKRRQCEKPLLELYYNELIANGVSKDEFSYEECYKEYAHGGPERWIWLVTFLKLSDEVHDYFNSQILEFCKDHNITPETVGQPRA
jgi:hypothetical protein